MKWKQARRKGFRGLVTRWDAFQVGLKIREAELCRIIFFFFLKILDRVRVEDIFELFGCIGDIVEVVIPPRLNKLGKRSGFARFKEIKDGRLFAVKLDNVIIDGKKIHANLPQYFEKMEGKYKLVDNTPINDYIYKSLRGSRLGEGSKRGARSFAKVVYCTKSKGYT